MTLSGLGWEEWPDRYLALPPVPMELASSRRQYRRYWRALVEAKLYDEGLDLEEVAAAIGVSTKTVRRDFEWLKQWDDEPKRLGRQCDACCGEVADHHRIRIG